MGDKLGDKTAKLGDKTGDKKKTSPVPDQMEDKAGDKRNSRPGRRTQQFRPDARQAETRWGARPGTSPARRTHHPSQSGHTKKALRTPQWSVWGIDLINCGKKCLCCLL